MMELIIVLGRLKDILELKNERNTSLDRCSLYDINYYTNVIGALI